MKKDTFIYDAEELELLEALDNDVWVDAPLTQKESQAYVDSAIYTKSLQEKKQTTIRFSVSDLAVVKARAKEMGIRYQNLIQALVHNYVSDKTKLEL
jgi:predicted DNA binding CopG/RHH family protein